MGTTGLRSPRSCPMATKFQMSRRPVVRNGKGNRGYEEEVRGSGQIDEGGVQQGARGVQSQDRVTDSILCATVSLLAVGVVKGRHQAGAKFLRQRRSCVLFPAICGAASACFQTAARGPRKQPVVSLTSVPPITDLICCNV